MKRTNLIYYLISTLFIIGIIGAGGLVLDEIETGNGCPKLGVIPACVIILICFIIPFIAHLRKKLYQMYFFFTGLAFSIALIASIMQLIGNGKCPKLDNGIPMCYLSLMIFFKLIVLKIIHLKKTKTN
jgi:hypothetical protein